MTKTICLIVDRRFGEQIKPLIDSDIAFWICDSEVNAKVVQQIWDDTKKDKFLVSLTKFANDSAESGEAMIIRLLDVINEHHGDDSSYGAWEEIKVIGSELTDRVQNKLLEFGAGKFQKLPKGFLFVKHA